MIERGIFRKTVSILVIISQVGCSNVKTIDVPPEALHERIRQGDLIKVSDSVRIVTVDEKEYRFVVTGITTDEIHGKVVKVSTEADEIREEAVTIPIDSVVAVKAQELSVGRTALLAGGVIGIMALIFIATAPAAILSAGGG